MLKFLKYILFCKKYYKNNKNEFTQLPDSASIYHTFQQDEKGNVINVLTGAEKGYVKLVHPTYGYEVVLDGNGNIVTNPVNMGTYNFYNPKLDGAEFNPLINDNFNHYIYDVLPYYDKGNSIQDKTIMEQRYERNKYFLKIKLNNLLNNLLNNK